MTTCLCGHPKDSHAKLGGCAAKSIPKAHQTSRARWACECEEYRPEGSARQLFYVHWNGAAWFVKDGDYFKAQGGLTQEWGRAWTPIRATSLEDARTRAAQQEVATNLPHQDAQTTPNTHQGTPSK